MLTSRPMTSRERVRRSLEFTRPDRVPRDLWLLPAARARYGAASMDAFTTRWPTDFTQCSVGRPPARRAKGDPYQTGISTDEWGCVFENLIPGVHGEVKHPILDDWSKLPDVRPPEEFLQVDVEAVNAFCRQTDRFVFASGWARPFERMQFIRGTEALLLDIAEDSAEFHRLLDLVHGFFRAQYEQWAKTEVDALAMMDDWGSQSALLISPEHWRRLFKPLYAEYVAIAHGSGKKFFMHTDGHVQAILGDLIEIGVDALNSQLFCMDIPAIGRLCRGRIAFWGEIDRQYILPRGTPAEARDAVRRVRQHLCTPDGGAIAQFSFQGDTLMENADAVFQEWDAPSCTS
jgi:uroporphyrinogen decarboxylase